MTCKCKKCGKKMNLPKGYADLCYDCDNEDYELFVRDKYGNEQIVGKLTSEMKFIKEKYKEKSDGGKA